MQKKQDKMYNIEYEVKGFDGTHCAGPYTKNEVECQLTDIAGYEGVTHVRIIQIADIEFDD